MEPNTSSDKLLSVLEAIAFAEGGSLKHVMQQTGLPFSTVYRMACELVERGFVVREGRGRYWVGPSAIGLARTSLRNLIGHVSRDNLRRLSKACRTHVHLGVLEEDMVTYLVKVPYGKDALHTIEGMQQEAYCSGIGKILLAHLTEAGRERYLSQGDFVALTPNTIVDRTLLAEELQRVGRQDYATDLEEIALGLHCIAVPVFAPDGTVCAAISASGHGGKWDRERLIRLLPLLRESSHEISLKLFGVRKFPMGRAA